MYEFDKSEVLANGTIQLRQVELFTLANGDTIKGGYIRRSYTPGTEISSIDCEKCRAIASAVWTQDVVEAYLTEQARIASLEVVPV